MPMDVRHLNHFLAVVERHSAGRAAEHLHITQPALSKSIRQLESSLGVALFERGPQGMTPTLYGKVLAERARFITVELRNVVLEIEALRDAKRGSTVIGASPSMMTGILAQAIAKLTAKRPRLFVNVIEGVEELLMPGLLGGSMDFIVGTWVPTTALKNVRSEFLLQDEIAVVAGVDHPLAQHRSIELRDTLEFPWVLPSENDSLRHHLDEAYRSAGLAPPRPQIVSSSARFIKSMLRAGRHLGYLPRLTTKVEEDARILVPLRVSPLTWLRKVHLTKRGRGSMPPAARALAAELREIGRGAQIFRSAYPRANQN